MTTTATTTVQNPIHRRIYGDETILVGKTEVLFFQQQEAATEKDMFTSLNPDFDELCFTPSTLAVFWKTHWQKLHDGGYSTILLCKVGEVYLKYFAYEGSWGGLNIGFHPFDPKAVDSEIVNRNCAIRVAIPKLIS